MKLAAPTLSHLARAYYELAQFGARSIGEKKPWPYRPESPEELLVICAILSRHDPRLFEVIVEFVLLKWHELNPLRLRACLRKAAVPQTLLTAFTFAVTGIDDAELEYMSDYLARGFSPAPDQLYFLSLHAPGGNSMHRAAAEPIREFAAWGFLARSRPVVHLGGERKTLGSWGVAARRNIILRLLKKRGQVTIRDYLEAVEHTISRQQALADLKAVPRLRSSGAGRGSVWGFNGKSPL